MHFRSYCVANSDPTTGQAFTIGILIAFQMFSSRLSQPIQPKAVPRNHIWGIDLTGKTDTHKNLHALLGILDPRACPELSRRSSRALLHLQALHNKTSQTLIVYIKEVVRTHGKPKIIRTDNEAIFTSKIFRLGMKQLGIRHQRTDPGCPLRLSSGQAWQNGRIERLFGTLKTSLTSGQCKTSRNLIATSIHLAIGITVFARTNI